MYTYVNDLPLIFFKNSLLCYRSLKSLECSSYKFLTNLVGLFFTLSWISKWIRNTNSRDNSIRTDCSGNRNNCTPYFSIPLTIVAPQRVQVPQVLTRRTASTCSSTNFLPISSPNLAAEFVAVPVPVVLAK